MKIIEKPDWKKWNEKEKSPKNIQWKESILDLCKVVQEEARKSVFRITIKLSPKQFKYLIEPQRERVSIYTRHRNIIFFKCNWFLLDYLRSFRQFDVRMSRFLYSSCRICNRNIEKYAVIQRQGNPDSHHHLRTRDVGGTDPTLVTNDVLYPTKSHVHCLRFDELVICLINGMYRSSSLHYTRNSWTTKYRSTSTVHE